MHAFSTTCSFKRARLSTGWLSGSTGCNRPSAVWTPESMSLSRLFAGPLLHLLSKAMCIQRIENKRCVEEGSHPRGSTGLAWGKSSINLSGFQFFLCSEGSGKRTSEATKCRTAYLETAMSGARLPSYVTNTSIGL